MRRAPGRRLAYQEAARHWELALQVVDACYRVDGPGRSEALVELGDAHRIAVSAPPQGPVHQRRDRAQGSLHGGRGFDHL